MTFIIVPLKSMHGFQGTEAQGLGISTSSLIIITLMGEAQFACYMSSSLRWFSAGESSMTSIAI